jgi:hypothetical protein
MEKMPLFKQHKYGENQWSALKSNESNKGREGDTLQLLEDIFLCGHHLVYRLHGTCSNASFVQQPS